MDLQEDIYSDFQNQFVRCFKHLASTIYLMSYSKKEKNIS